MDSVRASNDSAVEEDFGFGEGRFVGSTDRIEGASLVASLVVLVVESRLVTVGRVGFSRRVTLVFEGFVVFLLVKGEGESLEDATLLRRGRRVSWPEASAGLGSEVFLETLLFETGFGLFWFACFRIST